MNSPLLRCLARWTPVTVLVLLAARALAADLTPAEARALAREAYGYGFPLVEGYKTLHKQALDRSSSDFRAPFNQLGHSRSVATPADQAVVTPNSDTPYSYLWLDLRAEPYVVTLPKVEPQRFYSLQLIDLYTHNFAYGGTRSFGNEGGDFLIAGPSWRGEKPAGIRAVITAETEIVYGVFRTQLFNAADLPRVHEIQDGYAVRPLSSYLGKPAPPAPPAVEWPPLTRDMSETPAIFGYLNFLLRFCPTVPQERELMERFARLNIGAGRTFRLDDFPPAVREAIAAGIDDYWKIDFQQFMTRLNAGQVSSGEIFGTRQFLNGNYLYRFAAAKVGLYGNSREEALYPTYFVDADRQPLDASKHRYTLRFEKDGLPPARAFWSLTMYDGKSQLLVENPLHRYLLNSTMLKSFRFGEDGSLTLYVQKDSPGPDREANWLPAPDGPFYAILRLYLPQPEVLAGRWKQPPLRRVE